VPAEPIWLHPEAIREAHAARKWYEDRNADAADALMSELDAAIGRIEQGPGRWYLLHRFPFSIVFRETLDRVGIVAVAHAR
jgi:hypothetical protein